MTRPPTGADEPEFQARAGPHSRLIQILANLIGFNTTSQNSNLELIYYVRDYLSTYGVDSDLVYDELGDKANLYATIGPTHIGGMMLSGHTDVVPVEGQQWSIDPFVLNQTEGKIFGRGSADMKGFIACVLDKVPEIVKADLCKPIHIALSYDEEVGCIGVRGLLSTMESMTVLPAMAIIGEPTNMDIVVAHKGKRAIRVVVNGASSHSEYPTAGVNAIDFASRLVAHIGTLQKQIASEGPFDAGYQVPYSTLHVGTIKGGTALNIVPNRCSFDFEIRYLPGHDGDLLIDLIREHAENKLEPEMRTKNSDTGIEFEELYGYPPLITESSDSIVKFLLLLLEDRSKVEKISFGSEAGLFSSRVGIPSVVCGPGSIMQAHKADEYVTMDQLKVCSSMLDRLVQELTMRVE